MLRRHIVTLQAGVAGRLAALGHPRPGRCLAVIHKDARHGWTLAELAREVGLSRTVLSERFETVLGISSLKYLRDWQLCLASVALGTSVGPVVRTAEEAGYDTVAAFSRAFTRADGLPHATFRQKRRR